MKSSSKCSSLLLKPAVIRLNTTIQPTLLALTLVQSMPFLMLDMEEEPQTILSANLATTHAKLAYKDSQINIAILALQMFSEHSQDKHVLVMLAMLT